MWAGWMVPFKSASDGFFVDLWILDKAEHLSPLELLSSRRLASIRNLTATSICLRICLLSQNLVAPIWVILSLSQPFPAILWVPKASEIDITIGSVQGREDPPPQAFTPSKHNNYSFWLYLKDLKNIAKQKQFLNKHDLELYKCLICFVETPLFPWSWRQHFINITYTSRYK